MDVLTRNYIVTMGNGQRWSIPVERIAFNRAHYYAKKDGISFDESLKEDTWPLFEADGFEIEDWARNNMNWSDVKAHAKLVDTDDFCDFQEGWVDGEVAII